MIFPLYWMVVVALLQPAPSCSAATLRLWPRELTLDNCRAGWSARSRSSTWFGNSVAISLTVAILTVSVNLLAGYAFAQLRFRGSNALFLIALAT